MKIFLTFFLCNFSPFILILDSLSSFTGKKAHNKVITELRDYIFMEFRRKCPKLEAIEESNVKGHVLDVPQQPNNYDCGPFLFEYVEQFFKNQIEDLHPPFKSLLGWFDPQIVVAKKRKIISDIIKNIMVSQGRNHNLIPEIEF